MESESGVQTHLVAKNRLDALADGIYAIAATLFVLQGLEQARNAADRVHAALRQIMTFGAWAENAKA